MNRHTLKYWASLLALAMLVVLTLACGQITEPLGIALGEDRVNEILQEVVSSHTPEDMMAEITSVDMQDGFIRIYGAFRLESGTTVDGSCDLVITAQDGRLEAEITAVEVAGINLGDVNFDPVNQEIEEAFSSAAPADVVSFESVTITEDEMVIMIRVGLP